MSDLSQAAAAAEDDEVPTIEDVGAAPIRRDQMPQKVQVASLKRSCVRPGW